ncbi:MAG: hypothetical protein QM754_09340 [Tepidisphaeraceae bacterium]
MAAFCDAYPIEAHAGLGRPNLEPCGEQRLASGHGKRLLFDRFPGVIEQFGRD